MSCLLKLDLFLFVCLLKLDLFLFVSVCGICMCGVYTCMCMHAETREDHQMSYSITSLHNPLRQGFSLNLELTISASPVDQ